jgi:hypothetical protein
MVRRTPTDSSPAALTGRPSEWGPTMPRAVGQ